MSRDRVTCSACRGHGEVDLPAPHLWTLKVLGRIGPGWLTTDALLARHPAPIVTRTALVSRLNALRRWGFVDRRRSGRSMEWRRI
jgi:hypothetical protein